ncbi:hypothetical protein SK128_022132 [Halocaridina rubra]|uniref:Uncharacterized protein n=1 Tax=Halocaridina rubra TaxID=373956 RepID=A0AAN8XMK4_HALRR
MGHEVTNDIEMIVCRCQQLVRLEGEKIVDKSQIPGQLCFSRNLKFLLATSHDLEETKEGETTTVYQLQRKVKTLRESVDRKDLHIDMLRRKLALTEDAARASRHLEEERDELIAKYKRQCRIVERLNSEVGETRLQLRDLQSQLTEAADEKSRSTQQQKKLDELTAKINELDLIRSRQQKKITQLKEQVKNHGEQVLEERRLNESGLETMTQELAVTKQAVRDLTRREKQLQEFRRAVIELMGAEGEPGTEGDYEAICRLERIVGAHRELNDLSRRLDEITAPSRPNSARTLASRSPPLRSPSRPSSAIGHQPPYRVDSPPSDWITIDKLYFRLTVEQNFLDMSEELRALADDAHNHRPPPRHQLRRPPSALVSGHPSKYGVGPVHNSSPSHSFGHNHHMGHAPSPTQGHPHGHMIHHHPHIRTPSPSKRPSTDEDDYN